MSLYVLSADVNNGIIVVETLNQESFVDFSDNVASRYAEQGIEFDRVEDFYCDLDTMGDGVMYCVISDRNPYFKLMKKEYGVNF